MMPGKTAAIIAEYLAHAADAAEYSGVVQGIKTIEPPPQLLKCLRVEGCYSDAEGFSARLVYNLMMETNVAALKELYNDVSADYEPYEVARIDTKETTRRQWLANLYEVSRCYHYQICEGKVSESRFYLAFGAWIQKMADQLAEYIVKEVRPNNGSEDYKPWSEF